jgi:hypothetical protein
VRETNRMLHASLRTDVAAWRLRRMRFVSLTASYGRALRPTCSPV